VAAVASAAPEVTQAVSGAAPSEYGWGDPISEPIADGQVSES
jgi:hypothetical protein